MKKIGLFTLLAACSLLLFSCSARQKSGIFAPQTTMSNRSASINASKTAIGAMSAMTQMLSSGSSLKAPAYGGSRVVMAVNQPRPYESGPDALGYYTLASWSGGNGESISCKIKPTPDFFALPNPYAQITIDALMTIESPERHEDMTFHTVEDFNISTPANPVLIKVTESGTSVSYEKYSGAKYTSAFSGTFDAATNILDQTMNLDVGGGYTASISVKFLSLDVNNPQAAPLASGSGTISKDGSVIAKVVIATGASYYTLAEEGFGTQHFISDSEIFDN